MKKLAPRHADLVERLEEAVEILSIDPYNKGHNYPIKKLQGVPAGGGQYRLRSGRFRFRYDISVKEVVLHYCGLRARTPTEEAWCCGAEMAIQWEANVPDIY